MSMLTLGIDPGLTGALALLDADGQPELVTDLPVIRDRSLAWIDGAALQSAILDALQGRPCRAVVERASAMPGQGVASSFAFGVGLGSILATLQTLRLSIELVTPAAWKLAMGLGRDKRASLNKARLLFPTADLHLAKHDGRAEALLLAYFAQIRRREAAA
jgi:hypothetical protein